MNPTPPTATQYLIGNQGWGTSATACSNTYFWPTFVYAAESTPDDVTKLYTDSALTTPFNGGNAWWSFGYPYLFSRNAGFILFNGTLGGNTNCP